MGCISVGGRTCCSGAAGPEGQRSLPDQRGAGKAWLFLKLFELGQGLQGLLSSGLVGPEWRGAHQRRVDAGEKHAVYARLHAVVQTPVSHSLHAKPELSLSPPRQNLFQDTFDAHVAGYKLLKKVGDAFP